MVEDSSATWTQWQHPKTKNIYTLRLCLAGNLSDDELEACFRLVEQTSGDDYRKSSVGWHPAAKRKEMRSRDLRYILVQRAGGAVEGFTSLMPTHENYEAVVYCYEIHLVPELQG